MRTAKRRGNALCLADAQGDTGLTAYNTLTAVIAFSHLIPVDRIPKLGSGKSDFNRAKQIAIEAGGPSNLSAESGISTT